MDKFFRRSQIFQGEIVMNLKISISPEAVMDLDEIWDYIANVLKNPIAADRTINGILDKTDMLAEQPEIGTRLFFSDELNSGYRYVIYNNYLAFYRISADTVYIDRVIYGKRDYMKLLLS